MRRKPINNSPNLRENSKKTFNLETSGVTDCQALSCKSSIFGLEMAWNETRYPVSHWFKTCITLGLNLNDEHFTMNNNWEVSPLLSKLTIFQTSQCETVLSEMWYFCCISCCWEIQDDMVSLTFQVMLFDHLSCLP